MSDFFAGALPGAEFVVTTIAVGGRPGWQQDIDEDNAPDHLPLELIAGEGGAVAGRGAVCARGPPPLEARGP